MDEQQAQVIFEALGSEYFASQMGASHFKSLGNHGLAFTLPFKVRVEVINIEDTDRYNIVINNKRIYANLHKVILKHIITQHLQLTVTPID